MVGKVISSTLLFYLPVFAVAGVLAWFAGARDRRDAGGVVGRREMWLTGLAVAVLYTCIGVYFTRSVGEHSGDEGHYLIQADSLYRDHTLDLKSRFAGMPFEKLKNQHLSPYSRGGRWFSWHSPGLSFALAPFVGGGLWARHAVLGFFSGLGISAVMELCRLVGARRVWTRVAVWLLAASALWGVYSSRALPEIAGAALTAWAVAAILRQEKSPWSSIAIMLACCAYLPWLHTRFIPVSGLCGAILGLRFLFGREPLRRKVVLLVSLAAGGIVVFGGFFAAQFWMFNGGMPLPTGMILFSYLPGMWLVIASPRGILSTFPIFAALLGAAIWSVARDSGNRTGTFIAITLFATTLSLSCATEFYEGGSCMPGRYLVVVVPLFVPILARALGFMNRSGRWWVTSLGLVSVFDFVLMLSHLSEFGKAFGRPHQSIGILYPSFKGMLNLFAFDQTGKTLTAVLFLLITVALFFVPMRGPRPEERS